MNKKVWIITGALALVIAAVIGFYTKGTSSAQPGLNHEEVKSLITSQYPGTITELELENENNRIVYEVEIINDEYEYELKVDANTGEVLKLKEKRIAIAETVKNDAVKIDNDDDDDDDRDDKRNRTTEGTKNKTNEQSSKQQNNNTTQQPTKVVVKETNTPAKTQTNEQKNITKTEQKTTPKTEPKKETKAEPKKEQKQQKTTIIDRNQAIAIALAEFPGRVEDVELDDDDGRLIYEIEIENGDREAEFEIDAITGKIIVIEIDD